jgi:hypothetical protein
MLAIVLALFCDLVTPGHAAGTGADFTLVGSAVDARTVTVKGTGLPRNRRFTMRVDVEVPHASVACAKAFAKRARTDEQGRVSLKLISEDPDCDFVCDGHRTPLSVLLEFDGGGVAGTGPFECARNH